MFHPQIFCSFFAGNSSLAFSSKSFLLFCPFLTSCDLSHDSLSYSFIRCSYLTMPPQRGTISKGFTLVILRGKSPKRPLPPLSFMLVFTSSELVARQQQQADCLLPNLAPNFPTNRPRRDVPLLGDPEGSGTGLRRGLQIPNKRLFRLHVCSNSSPNTHQTYFLEFGYPPRHRKHGLRRRASSLQLSLMTGKNARR